MGGGGSAPRGPSRDTDPVLTLPPRRWDKSSDQRRSFPQGFLKSRELPFHSCRLEALLIFGAGQLSVVGVVHRKMLSSIPGLYPLTPVAPLPHCDNQIWGQNPPSLHREALASGLRVQKGAFQDHCLRTRVSCCLMALGWFSLFFLQKAELIGSFVCLTHPALTTSSLPTSGDPK